MTDLSRFAADTPLRSSSLGELCKCHWRSMLLSLDVITDEGSGAADTGTAAHHAVTVWHRNKDAEGAVRAMRDALNEFPLADLTEAERHFRDYASDPRNVSAKLLLLEAEGVVEIPPASYDPTGLPIRISGHIDQVREQYGIPHVWDIKTGARLDGWQMLHDHALQLAAYTLIATKLLGRPVRPGGVIRTRGYRSRERRKDDLSPPGVFFEVPWDAEDIPLLLDTVRDRVALIRRGEVFPTSGPWCSYCPAGGLQGCVPKLKEYLAS